MKLTGYILTRFLLLLGLVLLANEIYKRTFYKTDVDIHANTLAYIHMLPEDTEAIYFGESSNFHVSPHDSGKHRISHMLDILLEDVNLETVDNAGIHAGTYYSVMRHIPRDLPLRFLVVTMNYRSFDATWRYAKFENNLAKSARMSAPGLPILNKFLVSLRHYDHRSAEERTTQMRQAWRNEKFHIEGFQFDNVAQWDSAMAWQTWIGVNPYLRKDDIPLATHYIKNFAFEIDPATNERIADFDAIMDFANKRGYQVYFNLLDENFTEAEKLVPELIVLMERNRDFLVERYEKMGAVVVDNFRTVPDSCFVDRNWPTEHYSREGKMIIARNLARAILDDTR